MLGIGKAIQKSTPLESKNELVLHYDFTSASNMHTDVDRTSNPSDGDKVAAISNIATSPNRIGDFCVVTQGDDAYRSTWNEDGGQNNKGYLDFSGTSLHGYMLSPQRGHATGYYYGAVVPPSTGATSNRDGIVSRKKFTNYGISAFVVISSDVTDITGDQYIFQLGYKNGSVANNLLALRKKGSQDGPRVSTYELVGGSNEVAYDDDPDMAAGTCEVLSFSLRPDADPDTDVVGGESSFMYRNASVTSPDSQARRSAGPLIIYDMDTAGSTGLNFGAVFGLGGNISTSNTVSGSHWDGRMYELKIYAGRMSEKQHKKIADELVTKYDL